MQDGSQRWTIAVVAIGGAIGSSLRWGAGVAIGDPMGVPTFPWETFTVHVVGCLMVGVAAARLRRDSLGWSFAVTGVLGGLTTMSTFAVELNELTDAGSTGLAGTYLVATLVASGLAFAVALRGVVTTTSAEPADPPGPIAP